MHNAQIDEKSNEITLVLSKRGLYGHVRTNISEKWASFDQMRMINMRVVDSDANNKIVTNKIIKISENDNEKHNNSGYKTIKNKS